MRNHQFLQYKKVRLLLLEYDQLSSYSVLSFQLTYKATYTSYMKRKTTVKKGPKQTDPPNKPIRAL